MNIAIGGMTTYDSPWASDHQQSMHLLGRMHAHDVDVKSGMHQVVRYAFDRGRPCHLALVHKFPRDGPVLVKELVDRFAAKNVPVLLVNSAQTVNFLKPLNKKGKKPCSTCCIVTQIRGASRKELQKHLSTKGLSESVAQQ